MHPYITEFLVEEHQRELRAEAERERRAYRLAPPARWRALAGAGLIRLGTRLAGNPRPRARAA